MYHMVFVSIYNNVDDCFETAQSTWFYDDKFVYVQYRHSMNDYVSS